MKVGAGLLMASAALPAWAQQPANLLGPLSGQPDITATPLGPPGQTPSPGQAPVAAQAQPSAPASSVSPTAPPGQPKPMTTQAMLPGRWKLRGWQNRWVPADRTYRPVETRRFVEGRYVWDGGQWRWVSGHFE
jgi:hypothetical protein